MPKSSVTLSIAIFIFISGVIAITIYIKSKNLLKPINPAYQIITERTDDWREILSQKMKQGELAPEDFESLDFSRPNEADLGSDLRWKFFNPLGPYKAKPLPSTLLFLPLSDIPKVRVTFNLRRHYWVNRTLHSAAPLTKAEIFAIFTGGALNCQYVNGNLEDTPLISGLEIASNNKIMIVDKQEVRGCVRDDNGEHYLFIPIAERILYPEGWSSFEK